MSQASKENHKQNPTAAILVIGNEILSGRTLDKNTQYIAEKLFQRGIKVVEARTVPDFQEKIIAAVNHLRAEVDYVFTTGGIGPTHDDITAESIAIAFDAVFETHHKAYEILEKHYGRDELTPARARMAMMPRGVILINNPVSSAPGFQIGNVFVMAGVPRIMQAMLDDILPRLNSGMEIFTRTVSSTMPESKIADQLRDIQDRYPDVEIGSYPHFSAGNVGVSVVLRGTDQSKIDQAVLEVEDIFKE